MKNKKPMLLGTAGSEGIPCVFCECAVCNRAREMRGKEIRTRSSMLLDEKSIVDFSPDIFYQALQGGFTLNDLESVFFTHFHEDHVNVPELESRTSASPCLESPVSVYCSASTAHQIQTLFKLYYNYGRSDARDYFERFKLKIVMPWQTFEASGFHVTPILSSHHGYGVEAIGYNYIFEKNAKSLLYAVDTGWYPDETWHFLQGKALDCVVLEATYGDMELAPFSEEHLNIKNAIAMLEKLLELECITIGTPIIFTHICHIHTRTHDETQKMLSQSGFNMIMGCDFMELTFTFNDNEE